MADPFPPQSAQPLERRLATILCADVAGYSKMMAASEESTVRVFRGHREIFEALVQLHRGRIFNTAGDALLAEFNSPVEAVRCATEIQAALRTRNEHLAPDEKMQFRMGINLGDVIVQDSDLLGDGVNIAARIQAATAPGGICISGSVHDQIQNKLSLDFRLLGEQVYKNIAQPVRTYVVNEGGAVTTPARRVGWRVPAAIAAAALAIAGGGYWGYQQYDAYRAGQGGIDAKSAAPAAAQRAAADAAQRVAEEVQRAAQVQVQAQAQVQAQQRAADEGLRRAQEERLRVGQEHKRLEAERRAADAQRQAVAEALRHADAERTQLEQERQRLAAEKRAAATAQKPAEASPGADVTAPANTAPKLAAPHDGTYSGRLCNQPRDKAPFCWPVALLVRNGIAEGGWIGSTKQPATARGIVAADGGLQLKLTTSAPDGSAVEATLLGRVVDGAIAASGQWSNGAGVAGDWKRASRLGAPAPATDTPKASGSHDGTYSGKFCNQVRNKAPYCWPVVLVVRDGVANGRWIGNTGKTASAHGTVAADGSIELHVAAWAPSGTPVEAKLRGGIVDGAITASGQWNVGGGIYGEWKRTP